MPSNVKGNSWGNTYTLLCEGHGQTRIARTLGLSRKTIWKRTLFYLNEGMIEKIAWGVYRKAEKKCNPQPSKPVAIVTPLPIMLPHKFGATFAQTGRPALQYDENGKAEDETPLYYAQFGRYKTQIWLYGGFQGAHPDEIITSGRLQLEAIAQSLSSKYGITLTLDRFYTDIEWVDISKERSKATAKAAGMKPKVRVPVADAIHVYDGTSQKGHFEIDQMPGKSDKIPTAQARYRHNLYSGDYERRFEMLMLLHEKVAEQLIAIRARMELEAKR